MPDESISQEEINDLLAKLNAMPDLSDAQRALLYAIIKLAATVESFELDPDIPSFVDEFAAAFTPGKAAMIIGHAAGYAAGNYVAKYVAKTTHP